MKGLFVARQPGTVHAFEALIRDLEQRKVLSLSRLVVLSPTSPDLSFFSELENEKFDFILTGTSLSAKEDSQVWLWGKNKKIPTWAYHDQWTSTAERFQNVVTLPEHIFVVDEGAKKLTENLKLAVPVTVLGSPLWSQLVIQRAPTKNLAIFATEPIPDPKYKETHGFDDLDSLKMVIAGLAEQERSWKLEIQLHPIDQQKRIEDYLKLIKVPPQTQITFSRRSKQEVFEKTEFLFGMRSMILVEASLAGVPVVSFQPQRKTPSLATDREGIQVVTELSQVPEALKKAQTNISRLPELNSTELFLNFLKTRLHSI